MPRLMLLRHYCHAAMMLFLRATPPLYAAADTATPLTMSAIRHVERYVTIFSRLIYRYC